MKDISKVFLLGCCWLLLHNVKVRAQDSSQVYERMLAMPDKVFAQIDKKATDIDQKLARQTERYLSRLDKQEERLRKKVMKKDSLLAMQLFGDVNKRYAKLKTTSGKVSKYAQVYSGHLDSLCSSLQFLQGDKVSELANGSGLQKSLDQLDGLQDRFNQTDQIRKYLGQREAQLKEQLGKLGMLKELKKFRKSVYYYQSQVKEYRALFDHPHKLEQKVLDAAMKVPQFAGFFARNSQLAGLFSLPGSTGPGAVGTNIQGMQTSASISQVLQERFGSNRAAVNQALQQRGGGAQTNPLASLKDKVSRYSSGSAGNQGSEGKEIPDFKPNNQKTRSFLQRLEIGTNLQSQKARSFFPVTSDLGLSVGYKLNDKSVVGVGGAYKMGLGSGWNKLRITHQGLGVRSYVDYKIKGVLYVSGGYEQNYRAAFKAITQLKDYSAWQSSGLIGVSKRYAAGKKLKGEMKLLWDFLSYHQTPKAQPILFRLGYNIK